MSESSKDKTKRKQVNYLQDYRWVTQISFFYPDYEDSRHIIKDGDRIRRRIRRLNPNDAFLCKLRFKPMPAESIGNSPTDKANVTMPYWTIYSPKPFNTKEAEHLLPQGLSDVIYTKVRAVAEYRMDRTARAIMGQSLYSVEKHLGAKVNSFYIVNKSKLCLSKKDIEESPAPQVTQAPESFF